MKARVLIVGGGVMGTSIALHAAKRFDPLSEPVMLLERGELGEGSSGRSGAILRQHYADPEVAAMARDSLRFYADFLNTTGRSIGYRRTGALFLTSDPTRGENLRETVSMLHSIGIETSFVEAAEIRELAPGIEVSDDCVGTWEPDGGFVLPPRVINEFAALARTQGATTRLGSGVDALLIDGGRVVGVRCGDEEIEAEAVVVATGPWSKRLLSEAGIELPLRIVRPEQHFLLMPEVVHEDIESLMETQVRELAGHLVSLEEERMREDGADRQVAHPVVLDLDLGFYTRCEPVRLRTRVGRADHDQDVELEDPDQLDETVGEEMKRWARGVLEERFPIYRDRPDVESEAAWYTMSPDDQAAIGPWPDVEGLFVVTGFSGHGFKLAPSVGKGVAEMLSGDPVTAFDASFFDPARFREGRRAGRGGDFGL